MVSGDGEHLGLELKQLRQELVEELDLSYLTVEIPIFTGWVGLLEMEIEEVELLPALLQSPQFAFRGILLPFDGEHLHPDQVGDPLIHGITGYAGRVELIDLGHGGKFGAERSTAKERPIDAGLTAKDLLDPLAQQVEDSSGLEVLGLLTKGKGFQRRDSSLLGVGVAHPISEAWPAQDQHKAVLALGEELDPDAFDLGNRLAELGDDPLVLLVGRPASPSVDHLSLSKGREVASHRHIARGELYADADGRESSAADLMEEGVIAKEGEMARAASGSDAGGHRGEQA
jgi:hypothetical protein